MSIQHEVSRRNVLLGGGAGLLGAATGLAPLGAADAQATTELLAGRRPTTAGILPRAARRARPGGSRHLLCIPPARARRGLVGA